MKDTPADRRTRTLAHPRTQTHIGSRGYLRRGVVGEDKYSLSAGFSRIRASLLRAATVHFLPETRWQRMLAVSATASDDGIGSKVRSQPEKAAAATFKSKAGSEQEMLRCWQNYIVRNRLLCC